MGNAHIAISSERHADRVLAETGNDRTDDDHICALAPIQWRYAGHAGLFRLLTTNPELGVSGKLALELALTLYFALLFGMAMVIAVDLDTLRAVLARKTGLLASPVLFGRLLIGRRLDHAFLVRSAAFGGQDRQ